MYDFYPYPNAMTERDDVITLRELTEQARLKECVPQQLSADASSLVMSQAYEHNPATEAVNQSFRVR